MIRWLLVLAVALVFAWNNAHVQARVARLRAELVQQQHDQARLLVDHARELREALR